MTPKAKLKQLENLFSGVKKPIIGMIHLASLPGSPNHSNTLDEIIDLALTDLSSLIGGGINGVIIENFHDYPFFPSSTEALTVASMAIITREIVQSAKVPVGVNILRNACPEALAVAAVSGADFIRCNFLTGVSVTDQGLIQGCAHILKRLQKSLTLTGKLKEVLLFSDVHCKHAVPLAPRALDLASLDVLERGLADAIIISGERTGLPAKVTDLRLLQSKEIHPVLIGSGVNGKNFEALLSLADGAIIGTAFKKNGKIAEAVDEERVKNFMEKMSVLRKRLSMVSQ